MCFIHGIELKVNLHAWPLNIVKRCHNIIIHVLCVHTCDLITNLAKLEARCVCVRTVATLMTVYNVYTQVWLLECFKVNLTYIQCNLGCIFFTVTESAD